MTALTFDNVVVEYHPRRAASVQALAGVQLEVRTGDVVGLVGETGCGKSTLARSAVGLVEIAAGEVTLDGQRLDALGWRKRRRDEAVVQLIFQDPFSSLNPRRKVGSQVADGIRLLGPMSKRARMKRAKELLVAVGLPEDAAQRYPHQFSGGQRQRIAIARALAAEPEIVLADEPFASLDSSAQAQILSLLMSLREEFGLGLLLITHNLGVVRHVADTVAVMYLGLVVESAQTDVLWSLPLHPYTETLIASVPSVTVVGHLPPAVLGAVPDPADPPSGCRFHPRCPYAFARCRTESPPLIEVAPGRRTACWLHERGGPLEAPAVRAAALAGRSSAPAVE